MPTTSDHFRFQRARIFACACGAAALIALAGCEKKESSSKSTSAPPEDSSKESLWHMEEKAIVVGVEAEADDRELQAAIRQAQNTAAEARQRWESERQSALASSQPTQAGDLKGPAAAWEGRWAIKWAAPTAKRQIEHVWVRPVNWSPFRIEGILLNAPIDPLACGKGESEIVSFPIEELSDWIHYTGDPSLPLSAQSYEGGFTEKVLEARFGKPK